MSSTSLDDFLGIGDHGFGGSSISKKLKSLGIKYSLDCNHYMFKQKEYLLPTVKYVDGSVSPDEVFEQWFKLNHFYSTQKILVQFSTSIKRRFVVH